MDIIPFISLLKNGHQRREENDKREGGCWGRGEREKRRLSEYVWEGCLACLMARKEEIAP